MLCKIVGLDPAQVYSITITAELGKPAEVHASLYPTDMTSPLEATFRSYFIVNQPQPETENNP